MTLLLIGLLFYSQSLFLVGILLFSLTTFFQLVTLGGWRPGCTYRSCR